MQDIGEALLEYFVQFWSPYCRKDIIKLERVQKKFTMMLLGMEGLGYKEMLDRLGLPSLKCRRLRGLQTTRLGNHLEDRVNKFLRRQNHPEAGEVYVRVVSSSDKTVEVK
eukprot:g40142.t1